MIKCDDILSASDDVVVREVGGELVLLHLTSGFYFGLNPVGGRIWKLLEAGDHRLSQLCDVIVDEFDAPRETVEADLLALAADLAKNGLVERKPV